jgi:probable O-glycosylation ligase (exosortase A-associated)
MAPEQSENGPLILAYASIMTLVIDYVGLGYQVPLINMLKIPLLTTMGLLLYVLSRNSLGELLRYMQAKIMFLLLTLTAIGIFHSLITIRTVNGFKKQLGYMLLLVTAFYVFKSKRAMLILFRAMLVVHCYLIILNFDMLWKAVRKGSFNAGYFVSDGNDFAWSLMVFSPYALYLAAESTKMSAKLLYLAAYSMMLYGVLGTGSRGASIALACALMYYLFTGKRKGLAVLVLVALGIGVLMFAPSLYLERMASIKDYEQDSSAQQRLTAWKAAIHMAWDHPLGVGVNNFSSAYGRFYRQIYSDPYRYKGMRWTSAHSIYFMILGEYGFLGLALLLLLVSSMFFGSDRRRRLAAGFEGELTYDTRFFAVLNMSLIGWAMCGIFLGGVNYPHIYLLLAITLRGWAAFANDTGESK